jgi:cytoskeletal protein CcmA (bactofilin family)
MSLLDYFQKQTPKEHQELPYVNELHASGLFVQNDVVALEDVCVTKSMTGNIYSVKTVVVCKDVQVIGNINCKNCTLEGNVSGNVSALEMLEIKANAELNGNIMAGKLSVGSSAVLNGCVLTISPREARQISSDIKVKIDDIKQLITERENAVPEILSTPNTQNGFEKLNPDTEIAETKTQTPTIEPAAAEDNERWW